MAHNLKNHEGRCKYLHGHNYKMYITVMRNDNSSNYDDMFDVNKNEAASDYGMVMDFKELNRIVTEVILDVYDHSLMIWDNDDSFDVLIREYDTLKVNRVPYRPTAENMCKHFYKILNEYFTNNNYPVRMETIKIYETDNSYAEYYE